MRKDYVNRLPLVGGFAAHYYCRTAGTATEYTDDQWLELLARAYAIEGVILGTRALMDEHDPERKIPLLMDEWGAWHPVETGYPSRGLYQQNTVRDACVAALTLDRFHAHADKLFMANIAQLINVLQALLLVDEEHCIKTPTYHVFDLYRPHQGAVSVRLITDAENVTDGGPSADFCRTRYREEPAFGLPGVQGSASIRDGLTCVTLVNSHPRHTYEVRLRARGADWSEVERTDLVHPDLRAHNTPAEPARVSLSHPTRVAVPSDGEPVISLAPGAITRLVATG
jgi:alpha-N-arabinofuranosidase